MLRPQGGVLKAGRVWNIVAGKYFSGKMTTFSLAQFSHFGKVLI